MNYPARPHRTHSGGGATELIVIASYCKASGRRIPIISLCDLDMDPSLNRSSTA